LPTERCPIAEVTSVHGFVRPRYEDRDGRQSVVGDGSGSLGLRLFQLPGNFAQLEINLVRKGPAIDVEPLLENTHEKTK
jgi:hypothetical protein